MRGVLGLRGAAGKSDVGRGSVKVAAVDRSVDVLERRVAELEGELGIARRELRAAKQLVDSRTETVYPEHGGKEGGMDPIDAELNGVDQQSLDRELDSALTELEGLIQVVDALTGSPIDGGCPWIWTQVRFPVKTYCHLRAQTFPVGSNLTQVPLLPFFRPC